MCIIHNVTWWIMTKTRIAELQAPAGSQKKTLKLFLACSPSDSSTCADIKICFLNFPNHSTTVCVPVTSNLGQVFKIITFSSIYSQNSPAAPLSLFVCDEDGQSHCGVTQNPVFKTSSILGRLHPYLN